MAPHKSEGISGNSIQFLMSIFPITIGVFVGILGEVGFSYIEEHAKVSVPPKPVSYAKPSIRPADTLGIRNHPVDPPAVNQRKSADL